ncbi:MAG TPA: CapA family protein [bacterium]|nr:CapA family protein [bacterium]
MNLILLGDVMLGRLVNRALARGPAESPWGDTLPLLRRADAVVCNLECVIADGGRPEPGKMFTFRSDAANVAVLTAGHVAAVSLANNHTLDYGADALLECVDVLDRHGIAHAGAGRTLEEAQRPATFVAGATTVAMVACTDNEPGWAAGPRRPGLFYVPFSGNDVRCDELCAVISSVRPDADVVVASLHWGPNWGYEPPREHVDAARRLIDAGADLVFGHSPHVFRGVGTHRGRAVLYSSGDFVDDYAVDPVERNDQSFLCVLEYAGGRPGTLRLVPTVVREFQARLAAGVERREIEQKLQRLCAALGTEVHLTPDGLGWRPGD